MIANRRVIAGLPIGAADLALATIRGLVAFVAFLAGSWASLGLCDTSSQEIIQGVAADFGSEIADRCTAMDLARSFAWGRDERRRMGLRIGGPF